jgi:transcriptional regulator with XRE-family HTH domain
MIMVSRRSSTVDPTRTARLGAAVHAARIAARLSQADLAVRADVSRSYLAYFEGGQFADIGLDKASRLLAALGLDPTATLAAAGYPTATSAAAHDAAAVLATDYRLRGDRLTAALTVLNALANAPENQP